jgi:hypothetical protein
MRDGRQIAARLTNCADNYRKVGLMSCSFEIGDNVLWSPSNTIARLFKGQVEAVAAAFAVDSGLGEIVEDECEIELPAFEKFVAEAARQYGRATHPVLRSLTVSVIAVASVLVERACGRLPDAQPGQEADWAQLRREHAQFMPR